MKNHPSATKREAQDPAGAGEIQSSSLEAGDNWLETYLPYQLYRVSCLMNARLQGKLRKSGVNLSQWRVLSVLRSHGRLSLTRIVEHTLMEQPTVSRVVSQLELDGMTDRRISSEDSRIFEVGLTPKGAATFNAIVPAAFRHERTALEGLGEDRLAALRLMLQHIEQNIALEW